MRALILVLSALVIGLAVPVLLHKGGGARAGIAGEMLQLGRLLANAEPGEEATYRDQEGNTKTSIPLTVTVTQEPQGLDRLWVWARIRRETRPYHGKDQLCWRMDFIDPGLEPGADEVKTWFREDVPVFGLQEWHRGGRTWTLISSKPVAGGA